MYIIYIYGCADRKVNDAITFEQSDFSEIHESKPSEYVCSFPLILEFFPELDHAYMVGCIIKGST